MPKESKKFINPLLRPSQETEVKGEPAARPQKNLAPDPPQEESHALIEEAENKHIVPQEEALPEVPAVDIRPVSSTKPPAIAEAGMPIKTSANLPPASLPDDPVTSLHDEKKDVPTMYTNTEVDTATGDRQEERVSFPSSDAIAASASSYPAQNGMTTRSNVYPLTYTETETDTEIVSPPPFSQPPSPAQPAKLARGEKKTRTSFTAATAVRRRRGALTFENTHERITLWIDKGLKQAFEELAYERDLPKTALLNEAVADLLKKYDLL